MNCMWAGAVWTGRYAVCMRGGPGAAGTARVGLSVVPAPRAQRLLAQRTLLACCARHTTSRCSS